MNTSFCPQQPKVQKRADLLPKMNKSTISKTFPKAFGNIAMYLSTDQDFGQRYMPEASKLLINYFREVLHSPKIIFHY